MRMLLALLLLTAAPAGADRIKDIATLAGVRSNQLVGYGLVVGLDRTGDQTTQAPFTLQSLKNFLTRYGITLPPNVEPRLRNVASVAVHADLPPFAKLGQPIDVTVSALGNATSLRGGSLLMTPLRGPDGRVYAMAQGNLIVGGFGAQGMDGSRVSINIPSVGRIPNGALVERAVPTPLGEGGQVTLNVRRPDFTTTNRIVEAVNRTFGAGVARALDGASVAVRAPLDSNQRVSFISLLENIQVEPGSYPARVVVNARTGTVVIGQHVTVTAAAVAHGSLTVTITSDPLVSQPEAFSGGETVVVPRTDIQVEEEDSRMFYFPEGVTLQEIVANVNEVGAAPGDVIAILEALKEAGALRGELIVI